MEILTRTMPTDGLSIPYVVTQSYFATVKWDEAFFWALVLLITYLCGIVQSALGMMLYQHFRRTNTTSILIQTESELTQNTPTETPMTPPPMTMMTPQEIPSETVQRRPIVQGVPASIGAGFTPSTYAYHNDSRPCQNFRELRSAVKKRFTPCKVCWPQEAVPRTTWP